MNDYKPLKGFRDISDNDFIDLILEIIKIIKNYNFNFIELPVFEKTEIFTRTLGDDSDVVRKEMFKFIDIDKNEICAAPEKTAQVVRSAINKGNFNQKVYYYSPIFRRNNPQKNRYRQFYQIGCEIIGNKNPYQEIELLEIGSKILNQFNIDYKIKVNCIGDKEDRLKYKNYLINKFKENSHLLNEEEKNRDPFKVLDKNPNLFNLLRLDPILNSINEKTKTYFSIIKNYLDNYHNKNHIIDYSIFRGLDYYDTTVWEIQNDSTTLIGGGRYDGLFSIFNSKLNIPAVGFAVGLDRLLNYIKDKPILNVKDKALILIDDFNRMDIINNIKQNNNYIFDVYGFDNKPDKTIYKKIFYVRNGLIS